MSKAFRFTVLCGSARCHWASGSWHLKPT